MWWNWKQEKSITGVPADKVKINHSAMAHIVAQNLPQWPLKLKNQAQSIFADAKNLKTRHSAMARTEPSENPLF